MFLVFWLLITILAVIAALLITHIVGKLVGQKAEKIYKNFLDCDEQPIDRKE